MNQRELDRLLDQAAVEQAAAPKKRKRKTQDDRVRDALDSFDADRYRRASADEDGSDGDNDERDQSSSLSEELTKMAGMAATKSRPTFLARTPFAVVDGTLYFQGATLPAQRGNRVDYGDGNTCALLEVDSESLWMTYASANKAALDKLVREKVQALSSEDGTATAMDVSPEYLKLLRMAVFQVGSCIAGDSGAAGTIDRESAFLADLERRIGIGQLSASVGKPGKGKELRFDHTLKQGLLTLTSNRSEACLFWDGEDHYLFERGSGEPTVVINSTRYADVKGKGPNSYDLFKSMDGIFRSFAIDCIDQRAKERIAAVAKGAKDIDARELGVLVAMLAAKEKGKVDHDFKDWGIKLTDKITVYRTVPSYALRDWRENSDRHVIFPEQRVAVTIYPDVNGNHERGRPYATPYLMDNEQCPFTQEGSNMPICLGEYDWRRIDAMPLQTAIGTLLLDAAKVLTTGYTRTCRPHRLLRSFTHTARGTIQRQGIPITNDIIED